MAQISANSCSLCKSKTGNLFCYDCEHFLCQTCRIFHDKIPTTKDHSIVNAQTDGRRIFKAKPVCKSHQNEYIYYCKDCDCLTCRECTITTHNRHTTRGIKDVADFWRERTKLDIERMKTKTTTIKELLKKVECEHVQQIRSDVDSFLEKVNAVGDEFHQIIQQVTQINTTTATDFKQLEEENQIDTRVKLENLHEACTNTCLKLENLMEERHDVIFIFERQSLQNELEREDEIPELVVPKRMHIFHENSFTDMVIDGIEDRFTISKITAQSEKLDCLKQKYETSKQEIKELKQHATGKENEVRTLSQNVDSTKEKYKKKIQKLKQQIEEQESALSQLEENFREMQDSMAQIIQHKEQLVQDLESIQKVPDGKLKMQIVSLEKALKYSREQTEKLSRFSTAQRPQTAPVRQYKEMQKLVESLKGEKESLMQRLSMVTGIKLNPDIVDLSVLNMPEKLAEQFRGIYDNEWTDVWDYITENTEATDEIAVKLIVYVLKLMYEECRGNIHRRKLRMIKSIGYTEEVLIKQYTGGKEGHNPVVKLIKDLVRDSVERISDEVTRKTKELQDVKKVIEDGGKHGDLFVTKCIKLCLYMCTQDPPVILDFNIKNGDIFDKDRLSPFTASGDVIDYLVWPIMYLSDRGVLMSKGIAQGKKGGDK